MLIPQISAPLYTVQGGSVTFRKYVDQIFSFHVRQLKVVFVLEYLLLDDNALPHSAYGVSDHLQTQDVT